MRVKDLIKDLKALPQDLPVKYKDDEYLAEIRIATVYVARDALGYSETFVVIEK